MKYRLERNGNPDYVTVHLTVKVGGPYSEHYREGSDSDNRPCIVNPVLRIPGVEGVSLWPHAITAQIGRAFDPDEILNKIVDEVRNWLLEPGDTLEPSGPILRTDIEAAKEQPDYDYAFDPMNDFFDN